jgi:hypothetical protein
VDGVSPECARDESSRVTDVAGVAVPERFDPLDVPDVDETLGDDG